MGGALDWGSSGSYKVKMIMLLTQFGGAQILGTFSASPNRTCTNTALLPAQFLISLLVKGVKKVGSPT